MLKVKDWIQNKRNAQFEVTNMYKGEIDAVRRLSDGKAFYVGASMILNIVNFKVVYTIESFEKDYINVNLHIITDSNETRSKTQINNLNTGFI